MPPAVCDASIDRRLEDDERADERSTIASSSSPSSAFDTYARFGGETRRDAVVRRLVLVVNRFKTLKASQVERSKRDASRRDARSHGGVHGGSGTDSEDDRGDERWGDGWWGDGVDVGGEGEEREWKRERLCEGTDIVLVSSRCARARARAVACDFDFK